MSSGEDEQQLEVAAVVLGSDDQTADGSAVLHYAVSRALVDGAHYSIAGDYLAVLLEVLIAEPELLESAEIEGVLIVSDELLAVGIGERDE